MRIADSITANEAAVILPKLTYQNRLVCEIMQATGFRVGDVVALKKSDLEQLPRANWLTITEQKTGKRRSARIPRELALECLAQSGAIYVFQHRTDANRHRSRGAVAHDLRKARGDTDRVISPHSFRKAYAMARYQKDGDMEKLQRDLNHSRREYTEVYALADKRPKEDWRHG